MSANVNPKVALVTGCTNGGIGYHIADEFAKREYKVYATSRRVETMDFGKSPRANVQTLAMDVTSDKSVQSAVDEIIKREGKIDVVVNNAGIWMVSPLIDTTVDQAKNIFDTNVISVLRTSKAVLPHMAARKKGLIINIGSLSGQVATPFSGVYDASKSAQHALTDILDMECRPLGIDVMLVATGSIKTNIISNAAKSSGLPSDSLYKSFENKILGRLQFIQNDPGAWTAERFARELVNRADRPKPPKYWSDGGPAWTVYLLRWLPRPWVLSIVWKSLGA
ncbi:unnamed protein product [Somion occarium]|uniref:NAD(P)-binding protein n=1 Tax=Somion occarium TaxID=3059160 RepID=A0ABP1DZF2_9APHY